MHNKHTWLHCLFLQTNFCFNVLIKFLAFSLFVRFVPFCLVAFIRECVHIVYNKNNKHRAATKAYNFITAFITQNCIHAKKNIYAERNENAKNCKMHRTIGGRRRCCCCCCCCTSFMNRPILWCTTRTVNFFVIFASMLFFAFFFHFPFVVKLQDIYSEHSDRDGGKFTVSSFDCSVSFMLSNTFVASVHWFTHFSHRLASSNSMCFA